jgi:hypothetical protein
MSAAEAYIEDDQLLTNYASSSYLLAETTEQIDSNRFRTRTARAMMAARLALLEELNGEDKNAVQRMQVMEQSIVIGALGEYLKQKYDEGMEQVIAHLSFISEAEPIPTKIYDDRALKNMAEQTLAKRVVSGNWVIRRMMTYKPAYRTA